MAITISVKSTGSSGVEGFLQANIGFYPMPTTWEILSVNVNREINKIPSATLVLSDGNIAKGDFLISSTDFFHIGKKIKIDITHVKGTLHFEGFVTNHKIKMDKIHKNLIIELKDRVFQFTGERKSRRHKIKAGNTPVSYLYQHYCTDWDYFLCLAEFYGKWAVVDNGEVKTIPPGNYERGTSFNNTVYQFVFNDDEFCFREGIFGAPPQPQVDVPLEISYTNLDGEILGYEMEMDGSHLYRKFSEVGASENNPNFTVLNIVDADPHVSHGVENRHKIREADAVHLGREFFRVLNPRHGFEENSWIQAQEVKSRYSVYQGTIKVLGERYQDDGEFTQGDSKIFLGKKIEIKEMSRRFDGTTVVTSLHHRINKSGWTLEIGFGTSAEWHIDKYPEVIKSPAAALTPGVHGVQFGVIEENQVDRGDLSTISVNLDTSVEKITLSAKKMAKEGDNGTYYTYFSGDTVMLAFNNSYPNRPIIIGKIIPTEREAQRNEEERGFLSRLAKLFQ